MAAKCAPFTHLHPRGKYEWRRRERRERPKSFFCERGHRRRKSRRWKIRGKYDERTSQAREKSFMIRENPHRTVRFTFLGRKKKKEIFSSSFYNGQRLFWFFYFWSHGPFSSENSLFFPSENMWLEGRRYGWLSLVKKGFPLFWRAVSERAAMTWRTMIYDTLKREERSPLGMESSSGKENTFTFFPHACFK